MSAIRCANTLLGIERPLVVAPMAGPVTGVRAIAVLDWFRSRTAKPMTINSFCHLVPVPDTVWEERGQEQIGPNRRVLGLDPRAAVPVAERRPLTAANTCGPIRVKGEEAGPADFLPFRAVQAAGSGVAMPAGELTRKLIREASEIIRGLGRGSDLGIGPEVGQRRVASKTLGDGKRMGDSA